MDCTSRESVEPVEMTRDRDGKVLNMTNIMGSGMTRAHRVVPDTHISTQDGQTQLGPYISCNNRKGFT